VAVTAVANGGTIGPSSSWGLTMSGGPEEELMANPFLVVTECGQHQKGEHNNDIELGEEVTDGDGTWGEQMEGGGEAEVR
jgi:hypothetical protein